MAPPWTVTVFLQKLILDLVIAIEDILKCLARPGEIIISNQLKCDQQMAIYFDARASEEL
jgi:hypothetical protein